MMKKLAYCVLVIMIKLCAPSAMDKEDRISSRVFPHVDSMELYEEKNDNLSQWKDLLRWLQSSEHGMHSSPALSIIVDVLQTIEYAELATIETPPPDLKAEIMKQQLEWIANHWSGVPWHQIWRGDERREITRYSVIRNFLLKRSQTTLQRAKILDELQPIEEEGFTRANPLSSTITPIADWGDLLNSFQSSEEDFSSLSTLADALQSIECEKLAATETHTPDLKVEIMKQQLEWIANHWSETPWHQIWRGDERNEIIQYSAIRNFLLRRSQSQVNLQQTRLLKEIQPVAEKESSCCSGCLRWIFGK